MLSISLSIYNLLSIPILIEELSATIKASPINKATGPLRISNKMLKHLPPIALSYLLNILNSCLELEITPKQWAKANI